MDRNLRLKSLQALCSVLGLDISEESIKVVKSKVNSLRTTYGRELNKVKSSQKSGASTDDIYQPKWKYFQALDSFLRPHCMQRKGKDNISQEISVTSDTIEFDEILRSDEPDLDQLLLSVQTPINAMEEILPDIDIIKTPKATPEPPGKKKTKRSASDEALSLMSSISSTIQNRENKATSAFIAFGKYVSSEMAEMDPQNAKKAKKEILDILLQYTD